MFKFRNSQKKKMMFSAHHQKAVEVRCGKLSEIKKEQDITWWIALPSGRWCSSLHREGFLLWPAQVNGMWAKVKCVTSKGSFSSPLQVQFISAKVYLKLKSNFCSQAIFIITKMIRNLYYIKTFSKLYNSIAKVFLEGVEDTTGN